MSVRFTTGAIFLDCPANMRDEAVVEERLSQDVLHPDRRCPCRDVVVGITGDQNDRCGNVTVSQPADQVDAVHVRHFVVNYEAVDAGRAQRTEHRGTGSERSDIEPIRFKQEAQRSKDVGIVVHHVDSRFCSRHHRETRTRCSQRHFKLARIGDVTG